MALFANEIHKKSWNEKKESTKILWSDAHPQCTSSDEKFWCHGVIQWWSIRIAVIHWWSILRDSDRCYNYYIFYQKWGFPKSHGGTPKSHRPFVDGFSMVNKGTLRKAHPLVIRQALDRDIYHFVACGSKTLTIEAPWQGSAGGGFFDMGKHVET